MNPLLALLQEKEAREQQEQQVLKTLTIAYQFKDGKTMAGPLYSFLAKQMNRPVEWRFQRQVKAILLAKGVVTAYSKGITWFKGIEALDPTGDQTKQQEVLQRHYQDRQEYRERQRAHAKKRGKQAM